MKKIKVKYIKDQYAELYKLSKSELIAIIKDCDAAIIKAGGR